MSVEMLTAEYMETIGIPKAKALETVKNKHVLAAISLLVQLVDTVVGRSILSHL
jgi:hypothetical protein